MPANVRVPPINHKAENAEPVGKPRPTEKRPIAATSKESDGSEVGKGKKSKELFFANGGR